MNEMIKKILCFFRGFLIIILSMYVSYYILLFINEFIDIASANFWVKNLLYLATSILSFIIFLFIFRKQLKEEWTLFKENKKENFRIGKYYYLWGLLIMLISNVIIALLLNPDGIAANEEGNREIIKELPIYACFTMIVVGPIIEELAYRASFKNLFKNATVFALFTGLIFGGAHLMASFESFADIATNWQQLFYIIPYGSLGVAFGLIYYKSRTIYTTIFFHIFHNFLSIAMVFIAWGIEYLIN